ncbi:hypothetical protein CO615_02585 [Lysobacteraceae bacterium NML75-0749]|nr:hypothetical protein CO615_02585 [Xanthomonadaceae bacterium NML75-0749]
MKLPFSLRISTLTTALLLAGCATAPKPQTQPPEPVVKAPTNTPSLPEHAPEQDDAPRPAWQAPAETFPPGTALVRRIVEVAKREHAAWSQPFIDANGRLASRRTAEAERTRLADGSPAWERVVAYWRDSGTLQRVFGSYTSAYQCQDPLASSYTRSDCRSFVVDAPWSAAFISYVMVKAGASGFRHSASHIDYIRAAYRDNGPYGFADPNQTPVALGDMLCYVRNNRNVVGFGGLSAFLASSNGGLQSHCDIVVNLTPNEVWLVGGNVANMVAMRKLRLDAQGRAILPRPISNDWVASDEDGQSPACSPENEAACSMNRQNWAALLKLKPEAQ